MVVQLKKLHHLLHLLIDLLHTKRKENVKMRKSFKTKSRLCECRTLSYRCSLAELVVEFVQADLGVLGFPPAGQFEVFPLSGLDTELESIELMLKLFQ